MMQRARTFLGRVQPVSRYTLARYISTSSVKLKIVKCKLFDIGEGISEVEITQWNKKEGESVSEMETLLTVQSDKAAVDITSKYSGVLVKRYAEEKDIIKIGSYFCEIDTEDDIVEEEGNGEEVADNQAEATAVADEAPASSQVHQQGNKKSNVKASPGVKKKAQEYKLDMDEIGSYLNKDTITMEDVEQYHQKVKNGEISKAGSNVNEEGMEEVPLQGIKLAMCKSMNDSLSIPLFHLNEKYNVQNLINARNEIKKMVLEKENTNVTLTSILIKLISNVLKEFPLLNAKFDSKKNSYTTYKSHNVCVAMDTPNGLLVPNIKNVESKNMVEIQKDLTSLRDKAMQMKLSKSDITGGTITISNFGVIGGTFATPIVFDNQACIIGLSKIQKEFFLKNGKKELTELSDILVADTMNLTYGADHRFVDGATLARFSKKLNEVVEGVTSLDPYAV
ncbi:lipoamide acyltransferase component of branched-chain alpha-keto acid dehydrogenase complex, putative [Plasmodium knowlesi strain H]|uniref:Dihydrolipoamide acetyltransferase component of pyruvate dehydrogenase complex n=3 Tax=Plasmodium knowlesi TaxID=5850 RepID=A0A5K1VTX2_PLAKH|nr:lipoamide acyltransferase component of branched-chain alpha-keto acid dehydrogenase complex, putative [Plasmodium knowlesi strain H]OTN65896.1 Dihydrolipoamide acetyltransferase component of pyruvate dehydrogenase complex [Plasmodium knowlesi]CAA9988032.1 lipoamide acyltransferase component of branched-chain alpha-keto acid dehydrogenase complex, putative [Plasmodium knowlesi strain H]SBO21988.1 lipoamide acyltransferase component of branched-chain alpha-keto acid dehydrogenase complex, putat|eukprot:XP_002259011.1 dihydrolipoamide acyltransferase, putative [Plasmodium knowlesi strain H]